MLYPIVKVHRRRLTINEAINDPPPNDNVVQWFRDDWHARKGFAEVDARTEGVFINGQDFLNCADDVSEFCAAVREAWDAVRAIRHGTSLERFPRDLTQVSRQTETTP